jgi:membrane protein DedA with SNARE-associated domain
MQNQSTPTAVTLVVPAAAVIAWRGCNADRQSGKQAATGQSMRDFLRPLLLVTLALAVPIVPFVIFGDALDARIAAWLDPPPSAASVAAATVAVLAVDIFLPVPSSLVSTLAGSQLGILPALAASWLGMTVGATLGFALARYWGRPLALRFSSPQDLAGMDRLSERFGTWVLIVTRALPVLAEATVLLLGASRIAWGQFLPAMMLSNLGIAAVYSVLGSWAHSNDQLPLAMAASIALPLLAATAARTLLGGATTSVGDLSESQPPPADI